MWCFLLFMLTLAFPRFPGVLLKVKTATSAVLYWAFRLIIHTCFSLPDDQRFEFSSLALVPSLSTLCARVCPQLTIPTAWVSPLQSKDNLFGER